MYKIGASISPVRRLAKVASPDAILLHALPSANPFQIKNALHRRFDGCRADGPGREWFHLGDSDVEAISRLARIDTLDDLPIEFQPPAGKRSGENLNVWVRGDIADALRAYLSSVRPRTTKTASVEQALEDFLKSKGFPPKGCDDGGDN